MRASDRRKATEPSEVIEFVPRRELDRAEWEIEQQQREIGRLQKENDRLKQEGERLKQETERLRRELEAALRASKRQAAPHSRGKPKSNPKRPGRKLGRNYGKQACRPIPSRVDEQIIVPLPKCCPHCGGSDVQPESCQAQYQEDVVRKTVVRRFDIGWGVAEGVRGRCMDAIRCRPQTPWGWAPSNWDRRR
jgi:regulator of replication initiation timing